MHAGIVWGVSDSDRAREVFAEFRRGVAAQISPNDVDTRRGLAEAYADMGLLAEAIEELQKVLAVAPDDEAASTLLRRLSDKPARR